jgi:hypothetical protein
MANFDYLDRGHRNIKAYFQSPKERVWSMYIRLIPSFPAAPRQRSYSALGTCFALGTIGADRPSGNLFQSQWST